MQTSDLEIFNEMPFLFWVKDEQGKYLWGNRVISRLAGEEVAGKTDYELVWADDADGLRVADKEVWDKAEPVFTHEHVIKSHQGKATLNVCKWLAELDGVKRVFGISFVIE